MVGGLSRPLCGAGLQLQPVRPVKGLCTACTIARASSPLSEQRLCPPGHPLGLARLYRQYPVRLAQWHHTAGLPVRARQVHARGQSGARLAVRKAVGPRDAVLPACGTGDNMSSGMRLETCCLLTVHMGMALVPALQLAVAAATLPCLAH